MTRAALAAVLGLCGAVSAGAWVTVRPRGAPPAPSAAAVPSAHRLPAVRRAADPFARWSITEQFAAQGALVVQVETRHLGDALPIAKEIAAPFQERYAEILVYFHRPGRPDPLPPRRVQWSRGAGFVESVYTP